MSGEEAEVFILDHDLIEAVRAGDDSAFGTLWQRHHQPAQTVARLFTSSIDAEDLVAEAYAAVFEALRHGGGPTSGAFRPYLYTVIRNLARRWGSSRREFAVGELPEVAADADIPEEQVGAFDRGMVREAFETLPARWQEVLWYTEVEQMAPAQAAPLMGLTPNSTAALAYRAREGLRQAWLQAHVADAQRDGECAWAHAHLGEHSRDGLGKREGARMDTHLAECRTCRDVAMEVNQVSGQLAGVLAPAILGGSAGAAWLSGLGGAGSAAAAAGLSGGFLGGGLLGGGLFAGPLSVVGLVTIAGGLTLTGVALGGGSDSDPNTGTNSSVTLIDEASAGGDGLSGIVIDALAPELEGTTGTTGLTDTLSTLLGALGVADAVDGVTSTVSDTLNTTTDGVSTVVNEVTGGAVDTNVDVDLDLTDPKVDVNVGVGDDVGVDVGVDTDEGINVGVDIGGISLDVGIGGDNGLLGIDLFGKNTKK